MHSVPPAYLHGYVRLGAVKAGARSYCTEQPTLTANTITVKDKKLGNISSS
jgi:hypothetical protein